MGLVCTALHFKGVDQSKVVNAIQAALPEHRCFVSPQQHGWVTVLDEDCDDGSTDTIVKVAGPISRICNCPAIVLGVFESVIFYWLFDRAGALEDSSYPDDWGHITDEERAGLAGTPERITSLCRPGTTTEDVRRALSFQAVHKDENLRLLEQFLGLRLGNASMSFEDLFMFADELDERSVPGWSEYVFIDKGTALPASVI